jgi:GST-like protein
MMVQMTGIGPAFGNFVHFTMFAGPGNDYSVSRYRTEMKRLYELLEKRLGQTPYLGGAEYTIADIATWPWTRNREAQGVKDADNPNLARWFKAIADRAAVKRALEKVGKITSARETASADDKDRLFGRGKFARA